MAEEQVLNTHNAEILLSAANKSHYPQDDLPEVALAGRSNVGKSSFINTLLGRKNLARTSGKPGKLSCSISTILTTSYALWMCQVTVMPVCPKKNVPNGGK